MKDYHKLSKEIADLLKNPDAMKGLTLQQSLRKLGYIKVSNEPIEEHIQIDLEQYAKENGYVKPLSEDVILQIVQAYCTCGRGIELSKAIINARGNYCD